MPSAEGREVVTGTHVCSGGCGSELPVEEFEKVQKGLRDMAWYCPNCMRVRRTAATRQYRSDPEKRERDREASRRWKREHLGQPGLPRAAR